MRAILYSVVILLMVHKCYSWGSYRSKIPNGYKVPHPCNSSDIWKPVGHTESTHAAVTSNSARNIFGLHFKENDKKWNETLCDKDSDGDGKSNGEELGDPGCVWNVGDTPTRTTGLSHPGFCPDTVSNCVTLKSSASSCTSSSSYTSNPECFTLFDCPA